MIERRHGPSWRAALALLAGAGLLCLAATRAGAPRVEEAPFHAPALAALLERRGGLRAEAAATSLDAGVRQKHPTASATGPKVTTGSACDYLKKGCSQMTVAEGAEKQATRSLPAFDKVVVGDIINVVAYVVDPRGQPAVTFSAHESLLDSLEASVDAGKLTIGAGCACLSSALYLSPPTINATISGTVWPKSLQFRGASSAHISDLVAAVVRSEDAADVKIGTLTGDSLAVGCEQVGQLEIGSVQSSGDVTFTGAHACSLRVKEGSADASAVSISDDAHADLGAFAAQQTDISTMGAARFTGQTAQTGTFEASDASSLDTTVEDGGDAACSGVGHVQLHTTAAVTTHQDFPCSIDISAS